MAHDLQTPVAAIAGFTDILLTEGADADERRDFVERIESNARALEDLIDHLRTFSSLESGRVEIEPEPLDLAAQVRDVVAEMGPMLGDHGVCIEMGNVSVSADRRGLRRILQNLLSNAARHSPAGTEVQIRAAA